MDAATATTDEAGIGHNRPAAEWKRWTKKRTFVRALEGTYSDLQKGLLDLPRVYSTSDFPWHGGPQSFGKEIINPADVQCCQSIETHLKAFAPLGTNVNHGHLNSATFYVVRGRGHDIHDGERTFQWEVYAGFDYRMSDAMALNLNYIFGSSASSGASDQHDIELGVDWHIAEHQMLALGTRLSLDGDDEGDNWGIKLSYIFSLDAPSFGG